MTTTTSFSSAVATERGEGEEACSTRTECPSEGSARGVRVPVAARHDHHAAPLPEPHDRQEGAARFRAARYERKKAWRF